MRITLGFQVVEVVGCTAHGFALSVLGAAVQVVAACSEIADPTMCMPRWQVQAALEVWREELRRRALAQLAELGPGRPQLLEFDSEVGLLAQEFLLALQVRCPGTDLHTLACLNDGLDVVLYLLDEVLAVVGSGGVVFGDLVGDVQRLQPVLDGLPLPWPVLHVLCLVHDVLLGQSMLVPHLLEEEQQESFLRVSSVLDTGWGAALAGSSLVGAGAWQRRPIGMSPTSVLWRLR